MNIIRHILIIHKTIDFTHTIPINVAVWRCGGVADERKRRIYKFWMLAPLFV